MLTIDSNALDFHFPNVHEDARCRVDFQRTLRIPDDNRRHALPPGLGRFPLCHVDDHASRVPAAWKVHGGVMLPMHQCEALWVNFTGSYPCDVRIAAGKINAVNGEPWSAELSRSTQDHVVVPEQPWLDGFCVAEGEIRQFVAAPLGNGFTAEEQLTGEALHGGLQVQVFPMRRDAWDHLQRRRAMDFIDVHRSCFLVNDAAGDMGLAPGGRMRQQIHRSPHRADVWDTEAGLRCFVHLMNSERWQQVTGAPRRRRRSPRQATPPPDCLGSIITTKPLPRWPDRRSSRVSTAWRRQRSRPDTKS